MFFDNTGTIMVDVRSKDEYIEKTIEGAISVPLIDIHETLDRMLSGSIKTSDGFICNKEYIVFCDNGKRSQEAFIIFKKHGFKVFNGGSLV